jgi:hypothetical protein
MMATRGSTDDNGTPKAKIIGIAVGIALGVPFLVALGGLFCFMRYARALERQLQSQSQALQSHTWHLGKNHSVNVAQRRSSLRVHELSGVPAAPELSTVSRAELADKYVDSLLTR